MIPPLHYVLARVALAALVCCTLAACMTPRLQAADDPQTPRLEQDAAVMDDGARLPLRTWLPTEVPRAAIVAVHGLNDYSAGFEGTGTFLSARGLERTDRAGESSTRLLDSDHVTAPFSRAILSGGEYWLSDTLAYITTERVYRVPHEGGKPETVVTNRHHSPVTSKPGDEHLSAFAVDDQCVYWVRSRTGAGAELFAKSSTR